MVGVFAFNMAMNIKLRRKRCNKRNRRAYYEHKALTYSQRLELIEKRYGNTNY